MYVRYEDMIELARAYGYTEEIVDQREKALKAEIEKLQARIADLEARLADLEG